MSETNGGHGLSVNRINALVDGIYAVAMTLLVIDLKLPDPSALHAAADIRSALIALVPKFYTWFISFFVMALFWMGHCHAHSYLRHTSRPLLLLDIGQLAFVSLMPFSCALLGQTGGVLPQTIFSFNMTMLAIFAWMTSTYVYRHPELASPPMPRRMYQGATIRVAGLILVSGVAVLIEWRSGDTSGEGNLAFALMAVIMPLSRLVERAVGPAERRPARG